MNTPSDPRDPPVDEREWQAQERAFAAERAGAPAHDDDTRTREYRALTRVLDRWQDDAPPADFAAAVARVADARSPAAQNRRWSFWLPAGGAIAFGFAALVVGAIDPGFWPAARAATGAVLSPSDAPWTLALAVCAAVTAVLRRIDPPRV